MKINKPLTELIRRELINIDSLNNQQRINYLSKKKVVKKFSDKNTYSEGVYLLDNLVVAKKLKSNMNGYVFWKNEINNLIKLKDYPYFPKIIAADPINLIIYMTYCGESLQKIKSIPTNWKKQYHQIKMILLKKKINPNDIISRNICVLEDNLYLIDFGLANQNYKEIIKSLKKLENLLNLKQFN